MLSLIKIFDKNRRVLELDRLSDDARDGRVALLSQHFCFFVLVPEYDGARCLGLVVQSLMLSLSILRRWRCLDHDPVLVNIPTLEHRGPFQPLLNYLSLLHCLVPLKLVFGPAGALKVLVHLNDVACQITCMDYGIRILKHNLLAFHQFGEILDFLGG